MSRDEGATKPSFENLCGILSFFTFYLGHYFYSTITEWWKGRTAHWTRVKSGGTSYCKDTMSISTLSPLCHSGGEAMPEVKSEKEKIPQSFWKEGFMAPSSLLLRNTWTWDPSFWDLPSTSPTIYSTIPILPRPIKAGSYPWLRERAKLCCCIEILA